MDDGGRKRGKIIERRGCVAGGKDRETERKTRSCRERTRRFECSSREVQLASMDLPDR